MRTPRPVHPNPWYPCLVVLFFWLAVALVLYTFLLKR